MWQHGSIMNTHITVKWSLLGVSDPTVAARMSWALLNRAQKWAKAGATDPRPQRRSARFGDNFRLSYCYAHEYGGGAHSHILTHIPAASKLAFKAWARRAVAQLTRCPSVDRRAVKVVYSRERSESASVARAWLWTRYILKMLDPAIQWRPPWKSLRGILKVWPMQTCYLVPDIQMTGISRNLGPHAQRAAGFHPSILARQPDRIYYGDELQEWRERQRLAKVQALMATLNT
jgi:hypothetical protein